MGIRTSAVSARGLVLAAAIPILFLHVEYQPGFRVSAGSSTVHAYLSDFAVLAVVLTAVATGFRLGWKPLAEGRVLWIVGLLFVVWMFVAVGYGHAHAASYDWHHHVVTAAKFAEYALLAPAVPLLLRERRDVLTVAWSLALWSAVASVVGVAQFFGADMLRAGFNGAAGRRQGSFLSVSDFAALSGGALLLGAVALAAPRLRLGRRLTTVALAGGILGVILAGALAAVLGVVLGLLLVAGTLAVRRELRVGMIGRVALVAALVAVGGILIRGNDLDAFVRFVGATPGKQPRAAHIQTYSQRTVLLWLGYQIWRHDPVIGVGWEGSAEPANFVPYLAAARRRFPHVAPAAFPSGAPDRRYGVQDGWVQALADLGAVGFVLWVGVFAAAAFVSGRAALGGAGTGLYGLGLVGLLACLWTAQGFYAGIPLDALTWLGFGVGATRLAPLTGSERSAVTLSPA